MTVERDAPTVMAKAAEAVQDATEAVQTTSASIASAIEAGRRPGAFLDQLARLTRDVPLPALAMAFLLGVMIARRR
jgi:ABC-type transporter Mla maintaining outer membrane lipid asymmetry permease subunit MlaE